MWIELEDSRLERTLPTFEHITVLREETVQALAPKEGGIYLDATLGGGGHAEHLLESTRGTKVIGLDRDPLAIAAATERLAVFGDRFQTISGAFADAKELLEQIGVVRVDGILADLGVSSAQLDNADRGMSFRKEGPLDMRMDPTAGETALDLIVRMEQDELANVIFQYGEERRSRRVARCIKLALMDGRLHTTLDLRKAIVRAVGPTRVGGVDPATRTFQALRIAVNAELDQLEELLKSAPSLLAPDGILAIISFHSLEDRIVKRAFQDKTVWSNVYKKPITASSSAASDNPRSRSAKLRAAALVPNPEET